MGNFFAELRRRHIYRIGGLYVVVAWGITQVIDVLSQIYALPDWIAQPILAVLMIGFPVTLLFAWTIIGAAKATDTPAELKKATLTDWALLGALVVVIGLIGYQQFTSAPQQITGVEAAREAASDPETAVSVAAIPFANLSGEPEQESFADGITDEISSALARIPDLRVVARLSAYQFKGQNADAQTMGDVLGATHLIGGTVRRDGDRLRINANLVDVSEGAEIWSENFDRVFADVFAIQEEIATAVAGALGMQFGLAPGESLISSRTDDPEVYEDFLRARALYRARSLNETISLLESVVARDPNFAPAWSLLPAAYRYALNRNPDFIAGLAQDTQAASEMFQIVLRKSEAAAAEASRLDPAAPATIGAQAFVESMNGRRSESENLFRRALTIDPSNPEILDDFSQMLSFNGRLEEALALREELLTLEPAVAIFKIRFAEFALRGGPDQAAIELLEATDTDDTMFQTRRQVSLAIANIELGRHDAAADALLGIRTNLVERDLVEAAARLVRIPSDSANFDDDLPDFGFWLSFVYAHVGASERVIDAYERQLEVFGGGQFRDWSPLFADLRQTERFKNYIRASGVYDYWVESGFADQCRPVGEDDFECD